MTIVGLTLKYLVIYFGGLVDKVERKHDEKFASFCLKHQIHSAPLTYRAQYSVCLSTLCLVHTDMLQ